MKEKINKPRAFISYSSLDSAFIDRLDSSLRTCQIEPWRDRSEIRDGRSWLNSIFEEGLPTCDVIIAYFTSNSLKSDMVSREVDAAQLQLLLDKGVSFLPYVDCSETRNKLRLDLKSLQCRVWNAENFHDILPSVVAEIWRSYTERIVTVAVAQEHVRRLELELELQTLRSSLNDSAFSPQEEREFQHIYSKLTGVKDAVATLYAAQTTLPGQHPARLGRCHLKVSFIEALKLRIDNNLNYYDDYFLSEVETKLRTSNTLPELPISGKIRDLRFSSDLKPTLRMYGLLAEVNENVTLLRDLDVRSLVFSDKMFRFASWLDYQQKFGLDPLYQFIEFVQAT